jgi:hypothetical protein
MKKGIIVMLMLCAMSFGALFLAGCAKEDKGIRPGALLLLMSGEPAYFPEIPKGVAE